MRPATAVGSRQIPTGAAARALPPHCGGDGGGDSGIAAIAPFADENGRKEPAQTAVGCRRSRYEPFATTTSSAAYQNGALRDGRGARRRRDRRGHGTSRDG